MIIVLCHGDGDTFNGAFCFLHLVIMLCKLQRSQLQVDEVFYCQLPVSPHSKPFSVLSENHLLGITQSSENLSPLCLMVLAELSMPFWLERHCYTETSLYKGIFVQKFVVPPNWRSCKIAVWRDYPLNNLSR